jgi:hypothetical protein
MTTETKPTQIFKRKPHFNLYKPLSKEAAGAALQFSYDTVKQSIYLEAARQVGARLEIGSKEQFDWEGKIVFKLGVTDIGHLLLLFQGKKTEAKCIHSPPEGTHTSVLEVRKQTGQYDNYQLKLSKTDKSTNPSTTTSVGMYVDHHELALLAHFFREALTRMMGFGKE